MSGSGLVVNIDSEGIDRVKAILTNVPGGVKMAVGSALKRSASSAKTVAAKAVTQEYVLSQSMFRSNTRIVSKEHGGEINILFKGNVIPLLQFDTTVSNDGRVSTRVKRAESKKAIENAFVAQVGKHTGLFERETEGRFPIKELFGPSTAQMMYSNDAVKAEMSEKMAETFDKRIEHEITRILNGWGIPK